MLSSTSHFYIGQLIYHKRFKYRGVIIDVDPEFQNGGDWYNQMALSRPPKDKPWYRVLVHDAMHETYVAERNLENDTSNEPINHPLIDQFFSSYDMGTYKPRHKNN
jgi:heat shock protein HspQ